jgi:hypothetical protein
VEGVGHVLSEFPCESGFVHRRDESTKGIRYLLGPQAGSVRTNTLEVGAQGRLALKRKPELLDVLRPHAGEPIQAFGLEGGHAGDGRRGRTAVPEEGGAGQGVRTASRPTAVTKRFAPR